MKTLASFLPIIQIILSVAIVTAILLQQRGSGLSATFGGDGATFRTKRGIEKALSRLTVVMTVLLAASAIVAIVINNPV